MHNLEITALGGLSNVGKTSILNMLITNLIKDPRFTLVQGGAAANISVDSNAVFKYKSEIIYIATDGDTLNAVKNNISKGKSCS